MILEPRTFLLFFYLICSYLSSFSPSFFLIACFFFAFSLPISPISSVSQYSFIYSFFRLIGSPFSSSSTFFFQVAALIFKPLMPILPQSRPRYDNSCRGRCRSFWSRIINFEIWQNKRYVIWALAIPSALFGYFVPYIHLVTYYSGLVLLVKPYHSRLIILQLL